MAKQTDLLTRSEAIKRIQRAPEGARFHFLMIRDALTGEDSAFPSAATFSSRARATQAVQDLISDTIEGRGGRIRVWFWDDRPDAFWFSN